MNNNWNPSNGNAVWLFLLAVIVLVCVFALGLNVNDALTASGQVYKMNTETDIQKQKSQSDLELYKEQVQAKIVELQRQTEFTALEQKQNIEFRGKMLNAIASGVEALFLSLVFILAAFGITGSIRRSVSKAHPAQPQNLQSESKHSGPKSPEWYVARNEEIRQRKQQIHERRMQELIANSRPIWSSNKNSDYYPPPRSLAE